MITDKKLKNVILKHWDMQEPILIKDLYYGSTDKRSKNTWIVNDDYIIKIGTNLQGMKQHIKLSIALKEAGLETAVPVPTKDKNNYYIDNELYFCLMNIVKGESAKTSEIYEGDYKSKGRYLGEIIGQLHLVLQKHDKGLVCNEPNIYESVGNWAIPEIKKHMSLPDSFYEDYLEMFKTLYPCLPKHLIHRDLNLNNIIIKDGRLAGFIDFELSERNIRLFDPCYAATAILSEGFTESGDKKEQWFDIFKNIIQGYDSVCELSMEERRAIPYVIYSIQMICTAYFRCMDRYIELAEVNEKMLKWLYDNKNLLMI